MLYTLMMVFCSGWTYEFTKCVLLCVQLLLVPLNVKYEWKKMLWKKSKMTVLRLDLDRFGLHCKHQLKDVDTFYQNRWLKCFLEGRRCLKTTMSFQSKLFKNIQESSFHVLFILPLRMQNVFHLQFGFFTVLRLY